MHPFIVASLNAQSVKGNDVACKRCEISTFIKDNGVDLILVTETKGLVCLVGDMHIHFDNPQRSLTKQTLTTLSLLNLVHVITKPTHKCGHIIDWVDVRPDEDIHRKSVLTDSQDRTIIALNPTSMFQSLSLLTYTGLLETRLTFTVHHLLLNCPVFLITLRQNMLPQHLLLGQLLQLFRYLKKCHN